MATPDEWSIGYARQARADFDTFEALQDIEVPTCHKLQFLQMACVKLVKAHRCTTEATLDALQSSHVGIVAHLPLVLRQRAVVVNFTGRKATEVLNRARILAAEIEVLTPSVKRAERRPDNCEYPWEDDQGALHSPLDWTFPCSQLIVARSGRAILKLIRSDLEALLE